MTKRNLRSTAANRGLRRQPRGYALPLALLLAGVLAAAFIVFLTRLEGATTATTLAVKRRQAFYVADAVSRAATDIAGGMLSAMPAPGPDVDTDAEVSAFFAAQAAVVQTVLDAKKASLAPPGFTVQTLKIEGLGKRTIDTLSSGPFKGMRGQIQPFTIAVEVSHTGGLAAVSTMRSSIQRGTISMFQFWTFIDGYAYIYTGSGGKMAGRLHANGNVCMGGGGGGLYAEQVTSAGSFYVNRSSGCRREFAYHEANTLPVVATRPLTGGIDEVNTCNLSDTGVKVSASTGASYTCTGLWAKGGTGGTNLTGQFDRDGDNSADGVGTDLPESTWRATATNRWNGMLQDHAHGVPVLKVPITGQPLVQAGRDASFAAQKNNQNSRFLVDPMLPSESDDVRAQKLAFRADIRILNGVWYLRDPSAPSMLGKPIWSDHLGHYVRKLGEDTMSEAATALSTGGSGALRADVGQSDLFGGSARPRHYSYYRSSPSGSTMDAYSISDASTPSQRAVLSYGNVHRVVVGGRAYWVPGALVWNTGNDRFQTQAASSALELLQGTRSGFRDSWMQVGTYCNDSNGQRTRFMDTTKVSGSRDIDGTQLSASTGVGCNNDTNDNDAKRSYLFNILPINFDVGAFAAALSDPAANELGSFFSGGRTFNGIVWIGSYWPGLYNGFSATESSSTPPTSWPFQGRQSDLLQPSAFGTDLNGDGDIDDAGESTTSANASADGSGTTFSLGLNSGGVADLRTRDHAVMRRPPVMTSGTDHNARSSQQNLAYQSALPYPLCADLTDGADADSSDLNERAVLATGAAGDTFGGSMNASPSFILANCRRYLARDASRFEADAVLGTASAFSTYGPTSGVLTTFDGNGNGTAGETFETALAARPNGVRIMNAHHLDRTVFPQGLTIATNLPAYLLGDTNATSVPANKPADAVAITTVPTTEWRPMLIAADVVAVQSNAWEDWRAQWNAPVRHTSGFVDADARRTASETRYYVEILAGWLESRDGNRDETFYFTRLLENWAPVARRLRGSVVIGFASEFGMRFNWNGQSNNDGGLGEYAYDYMLDIPDNQPPGAPKFTVTATETFRRN